MPLRIAIVASSLFLCALAAAEPDGLEQAIANAEAAMDQPALTPNEKECARLQPLWDALPVRLDPAHPNYLDYAWTKKRLRERRGAYDCPKGPPTDEKLPTVDELYAVYMASLAEVRQTAAQCKTEGGCPGLSKAQNTLKRRAAYLLQKLRVGSERALEVERSLGTALATDAETSVLVAVIGSRPLDDDTKATLFEIATSDDPHLTRRAQELLGKLKDKSLTDDEITSLLGEVAKLAAKHGRDTLGLVQSAAVEAMLSDADKRQVLARVLDLIVKRYPQLAAGVANARSALDKNQPDEAIVRRFFDSLDPVVFAEVYKDSRLANAVVPNATTETGVAPSPVLVHIAQEVDTLDKSCRPGDEFLRKFVATLHFQGGPKSGLQPFVRVKDKARVLREIPAILKQESQAPACEEYRRLCPPSRLAAECTEELLPYDRLCSFPKPGIFVLSVEKAGNAEVAVSGSWWARSDTGTWDSGTVPPVTVPVPCKADYENTVAATSAQELASRVSLFKPGLLHEKDGVRVETRSSAWLAAGFSGAPYLNDSRATTTSRLLPTLIDGLLLVGIGGSFAYSVHYRNEYAIGDERTLGPANDALTTGVALLGALAATRLVSGLVYGHTTWWQAGSAK